MRWGRILITVFCGLIVGLGVPLTMQKLPPGVSAVRQTATPVKQGEYVPQTLPTQTYHFQLKDGKLAVVEKESDGSEQVIVSGLDTAGWPANILNMVPRVEFGSLDEVQSFIDSTSELMNSE